MSVDDVPKIVNILMVDDSESDVDITREVMEESKIANRLDVVHNGEEALRYLRADPPYQDRVFPDILLLDLNMPKMDGRQVLTEIREDPALTHLPVVVLTSSRSEEDIAKSYRLHANCYVSKPIGIDQFIRVVNQLGNFWLTVVRLP